MSLCIYEQATSVALRYNDLENDDLSLYSLIILLNTFNWTTMSSASTHLQAAAYSIASNISVQIFARALTFILRAISLKYLHSSALLGIIHVRLALLYTTLQFLSREPFRRACLGEVAKSNQKSWYKIFNTVWLGLLISLLLFFPLAYVWQLNSPSLEDLEGTTDEDYKMAVIITCISVIVEMLAEPCYIYAQAKAIIKHNPVVEIINVTTKCILACFFVVESAHYSHGQPSHILTKTAISQLIASLISVIYSYRQICKNEKISYTTFMPTFRRPVEVKKENKLLGGYFDTKSLKLSYSFLSQTILKQLLTEGERYVMTFFNVITLSDQGIYDVINNLGSLAARLIFKPIEDSGYTLFSQLVKRDEILDIRRFYRVQEYLMFMIKSMLILGLVVFTFGYNFVPLIVLYGGEKLNNPLAFHLMKWQLFYIPFLAVNGVTECFTFAVMNTVEIKSYNYHMIHYSILFLSSIYLMQPLLGSACFILANCVTMTLRIYFSYKIIRDYFYKHGYKPKLQETIPDLTTLVSLTGVFIFLRISQHYLLDMTQPLSMFFGVILGAWCLLFVGHVIACHEEALVNFAYKLFKLKTSKNE